MTSASDLLFRKCKWIPQSLEQKHNASSSKKEKKSKGRKATETGFEDFFQDIILELIFYDLSFANRTLAMLVVV